MIPVPATQVSSLTLFDTTNALRLCFFFSSSSVAIADPCVHHRNALNLFSFIALRTSLVTTAGC